MPHPRIAKISVGETRGAEKGHLEKPEQDNGHFAEKERALNIRRHRCSLNVGGDENIVQHHQREGQHGGRAQNVQRIRQGNEPPLSRSQIEEVTNQHAEHDEVGQDTQQQRQAISEKVAFETQIETRQQQQTAVASASCVAINALRRVRFGRRIMSLTGDRDCWDCAVCEAADSPSGARMPAVMIWRELPGPAVVSFGAAPQHHPAGDTDAQHVHPAFVEIEHMRIEQRGKDILYDDQ